MGIECCICKKVDASEEYLVKLHKSHEQISVKIPVCHDCKADFKLLGQLLVVFAWFIIVIFSTIILFMAWGYQHTGESTTATLFALSTLLIAYLGHIWSKSMLGKSFFTRMSREYPQVMAKIKEGYAYV